MKSFKYTINGNVYKVHINSVVDDIADVEVNGIFKTFQIGRAHV